MLRLYQYISVVERKYGPKLRYMVPASSRKQNSFNNPRKDDEFGIDLVGSMCNTPWTLELATVSGVFTSSLKHHNQ